jgi:hypothetical protein
LQRGLCDYGLSLAFFGQSVLAHMLAAYQNTPLPHLKQPVMFDDLIPAYEHCWDYRTNDGQRVSVDRFSDEALAQVAECERTTDRWEIFRNGVLIALGVPIIALGLGWAFVWAFRGFLPAQKP